MRQIYSDKPADENGRAAASSVGPERGSGGIASTHEAHLSASVATPIAEPPPATDDSAAKASDQPGASTPADQPTAPAAAEEPDEQGVVGPAAGGEGEADTAANDSGSDSPTVVIVDPVNVDPTVSAVVPSEPPLSPVPPTPPVSEPPAPPADPVPPLPSVDPEPPLPPVGSPPPSP